jgi:TolB-like protein/lipoprotein NlpI
MNRLLKELARRNVLRVAVLYVVLAWIILQVADVLFGFLQLPAWAGKLTLALLLLGFPLVLIFAWAFEITPDGIKRESEVDRTQSITPQTARKINVLTGILGGIAILLIVAQGFIPGMRPSARGAGTHRGDVAAASIAVLPFANMSSDPEQEYFSDGLSEELLNLLAKIPELTVISRTSSFQFKDKNEDVRKIGQMLGVAHVLEGSVRKSANTVRITAQLIDAEDGSHLWSQTYDRNLHDIFAVQDEIAGAVVQALQVTLLGEAPRATSTSQNTEAYNLVLKARHLENQQSSEGFAKAVTYLEQALALEPGYALAWSRLAGIFAAQVGRGELPIDAGMAKAQQAAERAVELDPQLAEAHVVLGRIAIMWERDWAAAETHLRQAEALDPSNYGMLNTNATLAMTLGRFDQAIAVYRRLTDSDPLLPVAFANLGLALTAVDSLAAAEASFRHALELAPNMVGMHSQLGLTHLLAQRPQEALAEALQEKSDIWRMIALPSVYHALGRKAESDAALRELEHNLADDGAYQIAQAYAYRGDLDKAFEWLERAYKQRDGGLTEIKGDRLIDNIKGDPRYRALLRKLKLPE